jgi:hypothetical protein
MKSLECLIAEDFMQFGAVVSTAEALHEALRRRPEVAELRAAIAIQAIEPKSVEEFTRSLVQQVELGRRSSFDVAFAALAVIYEAMPGPFAARYLNKLSALRIAELPLSPRVARISLSVRARKVPSTSVAKSQMTKVPQRFIPVKVSA